MTLASLIFLVAVRLVLLFGAAPSTDASPLAVSNALEVRSTASNYWVNNIARQGTSPWGPSGYQVFRNVQAFGAKGDGVTDDTAAINAAISSGSRCGQGCDSSTVTPALVYFPPGTYMISSPIVQYYFTQLVGDALTIPRLKATSKFSGMAVIDSDPYLSGGANWYTNQNNFYRQVRNFVIDLTALPQSTGTGIHWQVAQATSLQNIVFQMVQGGGTANKQTGIFMDNGSGGFMTDLTFNGGNQGMFLGNQQFETKNLTFNGCNTGIYMNWNWVWQIKSAHFSNCGVGIDMTSGGTTPSVGSVSVLDSSFPGTPIGIKTNSIRATTQRQAPLSCLTMSTSPTAQLPYKTMVKVHSTATKSSQIGHKVERTSAPMVSPLLVINRLPTSQPPSSPMANSLSVPSRSTRAIRPRHSSVSSPTGPRATAAPMTLRPSRMP